LVSCTAALDHPTSVFSASLAALVHQEVPVYYFLGRFGDTFEFLGSRKGAKNDMLQFIRALLAPKTVGHFWPPPWFASEPVSDPILAPFSMLLLL